MEKCVNIFKLILSIYVGLFLMNCSRTSSSSSQEQQVQDVNHIVSGGSSYVEKNESTNQTRTQAEDTGYVLDEVGLTIQGEFEGSSPSTDFYKINTGAFDRVQVQVYVNGQRETSENHLTFVSLDNFIDDGYSSIMGPGYFNRAWIQTQSQWTLSVFTNAALGSRYTIELKGVP